MNKIKLNLNLSSFFLLILLFVFSSVPVLPASAQDTKSPYSFSSKEFKRESPGIKVKAPDGWDIYPTLSIMENLSSYSKDEMKKLEEMKKGLDKKKDAKKIKEIEESLKDLREAQKDGKTVRDKKEDIISLFNASPVNVKSTCIVSVKAIKLELLDGIKTGGDYLKIVQPPSGSAKKQLKTSQALIGSLNFDFTEIQITMPDQNTKKSETLTHKTYAAPVKNYMMVITTTASTKDEKLIKEFLKGISFK